jgi:hypothetical protein
MKYPSHECLLTAELCRIDHTLTKPPGCAPVVATRVCALARSYRRLNEARCNRELRVAEQRKMQSLQERADALLLPYGLCMGHPGGLCMYALPTPPCAVSSSSAMVIA